MCDSRIYPYTHPKEGHWKFRGGGVSQKPKVLKESMKLNWNFQRGGVWNQKTFPSMSGVWIFSGTTQWSEFKGRMKESAHVLKWRGPSSEILRGPEFRFMWVWLKFICTLKMHLFYYKPYLICLHFLITIQMIASDTFLSPYVFRLKNKGTWITLMVVILDLNTLSGT